MMNNEELNQNPENSTPVEPVAPGIESTTLGETIVNTNLNPEMSVPEPTPVPNTEGEGFNTAIPVGNPEPIENPQPVEQPTPQPEPTPVVNNVGDEYVASSQSILDPTPVSEPAAPEQVVPAPELEPIADPNFGQDVPPVEVTAPSESETPQPTKKKSKAGIVIVLIIVLLAISAAGVYYFYFKDGMGSVTPKQVFTKTLNAIANNSSKALDKSVSASTLSIEYNPASGSSVKPVNLTMKVDSDLQNDYTKANVSLKYDNKDALTGNAYLSGGKLYLQSTDLMDKTVYIDNMSALTESKNIDFAKISNGLINALNTSFKDEYFSRETVGSLVANKFKVEGDTLKAFMTDYVNNIKSNQELVTELKKINSNISFDNYNPKVDSNDSLEMIIYTSGNSISKVTFTMTNDGKSSTMEINNVIDNGFDYSIKDNSVDISGKVTYSFTDSAVSSKITMSVSGNTITIALDKTNNATITKDDISNLNAVSVNELTEFDMLVLQSRITNNAAINSLISALSGNTTSSISNVNI